MGERLAVPPHLQHELRGIRADNPGPFTLDGTRTWIVGERLSAIVEPGPDVADHVRAVVRSVQGADAVTLLLSHGHGDHVGGVDRMLEALEHGGMRVRVAGAGHPRAEPMADGEEVVTDAGVLVALETPGHTPDHLAFHWPRRRLLFPGDLVLGQGETTWVAGYPGCVADYLASLRRLADLDLDLIVPAHGPLLRDPSAALERFAAHRRERIRQVRVARGERPDARPRELLDRVYGGRVPPELEEAALASLQALLEYVEAHPSDRSG